MKKHVRLALYVVASILPVFIGNAIIEEGIWPEGWPKELEQFRKQTKSYHLSSGTEEVWHEIIFQKQQAFEDAWPHILKLKTEGAPIILEGPSTSHGIYDPFLRVGQPGVRILCSAPPGRGFSEETRNRPATWPDYLKLQSGSLPEYVTYKNGKWTAAHIEEGQAQELPEIFYRARTDIVLIVDGTVVDLNRVPLPDNTPVIDRRFESKTN